MVNHQKNCGCLSSKTVFWTNCKPEHIFPLSKKMHYSTKKKAFYIFLDNGKRVPAFTSPERGQGRLKQNQASDVDVQAWTDTTERNSYYIKRSKTKDYDDSILFRKRQPYFAKISITSDSNTLQAVIIDVESSSRLCSFAHR
jgi:hypothetical protein